MTNHLRTPPHSTMAEQAVLGGLMIENRMWPAVHEILGASDFYRNEHRIIFASMEKLENKREPIDLVTVAEQLEKTGKIEESGGLQYLTKLADQTPSTANIIAYAKSVRENADRRKLIAAGTKIIEQAFGSTELTEVVNEAESSLLKLSQGSQEVGPVSITDAMHGYLEDLDRRHLGQSHGLRTGFHDLDQMINGLRDGNFAIVAGRPAMGKTTFAMNIAENVAIHASRQVLFFSLEMEKHEIIDRMLASQGRIPLQDIIKGQIDNHDISEPLAKITRGALTIDDTGGISINQIRARAIRHMRKHGLDLIVIDYLQLVRCKAENRVQEISEISRALKALAKELKVPIIALSQLNRKLEERTNKRPVLSDLRESGQIEQDADLIVFLYRDEVYNDNSPDKGIAEIIVGKQRNGPIGTTRLTFLGKYTKFENYAGRIDIPAPQRPAFEYN